MVAVQMNYLSWENRSQVNVASVVRLADSGNKHSVFSNIIDKIDFVTK